MTRDSKEALCAALRELMQTQPFDSISAQGVCDRAGLSRKTFSRHFVDLQDVVKYQIYLDFVKPACDLDRIMGGIYPSRMMSILRNLRVLREHESYYREVARRYSSLWFAGQFADAALSIDFDPYEDLPIGAAELNFAESYHATAVAMAFRWWLDSGMALPEEEMARIIEAWVYAHSRELRGASWAEGASI